MPITYHIREDRELIVLCHVGTITDRQMLESLHGLTQDPRFNPNYSKIFDLRQTDSEARTNEGIMQGAELLKKAHRQSTGAQIAVIAPKDLSYGLSRIFEGMLYDGNFEIKIFRSADAACDWLKLCEDDLAIPETGQ